MLSSDFHCKENDETTAAARLIQTFFLAIFPNIRRSKNLANHRNLVWLINISIILFFIMYGYHLKYTGIYLGTRFELITSDVDLCTWRQPNRWWSKKKDKETLLNAYKYIELSENKEKLSTRKYYQIAMCWQLRMLV